MASEFLNNNVLDFGLDYIATDIGDAALRMDICHTQAPVTYAEATSTYSCGNEQDIATTGPANGTSGRKLTIDAITTGTVTGNGTAGWWALTDGSSILIATGPLAAPQPLYSGGSFTLTATDITIPDISAGRFLADSVFDNGLDYLTANGTRVDLCSALPSSWANMLTITCGNKTGVTVGSPQAGTNGRKVVIPAITGGTVTSTTAACTHWALSDGTGELLAAGPLTSPITLASTENFWQLQAIDVEFKAIDPNAAILPQLIVDTTYSLPVGLTRTVGVGKDYTNLQTAIDAANGGDVLVLTAGETFTGNFVLPNKAGTDWIYIISSELSALTLGDRVAPADAVSMPEIKTTNGIAAIRANFSAHHYRFAGIKLTSSGTDGVTIELGRDGVSGLYVTDPSDESHHIIFDRCLITTTGTNPYFTVALNSTYAAVIDSYVVNGVGSHESQAIKITNTTGPVKIANNYLEATTENVLFGGENFKVGDEGPADIEVIGNYFYKNPAWGTTYNVKNLLEFKLGIRVHVTGNILEHCWSDSQDGTAILFTVRNQTGANPSALIRDVTFENNIVREAGQAFSLHSSDNLQTSQATSRIVIRNNFIENLRSDYRGATNVFTITKYLTITLDHMRVTNNLFLHKLSELGNSIFNWSSGIILDDCIYQNNINTHASYGGNSHGTHMSNYVFATNGFIMHASTDPFYIDNFGTIHPGNTMVANVDAADFTNYATGNYILLPTSAFYQTGSDGRDMGPNWAELDSATQYTLTGVH